jgi:hypothetical protein
MELLPQQELKELIEHSSQYCISLYMPTFQAGAETQQNSIRMKNMLKEAGRLLEETGLRKPEIETLLAPGESLVDDRVFWQHQSDGLAVFMADGEISTYQLPLNFKELAVVSYRFHLKPLLPLLSGDGEFYVLTLSMGGTSLLRGTRYSLTEIEVPDLPKSLDDALKYDIADRSLQYHTLARGEGGKDAMFHGHGDGYDKKENILRYFQQVDAAIQDRLDGRNKPLVLAGVDYLLPIYREANQYSHLMENGIELHPETLSEKDLHRKVWEIVSPHFQQEQDTARDDYFVMKQRKLASNKIEEIVPAAYFGRVSSLFTALKVERWGAFDSQSGEVTLYDKEEEGRQDLLDLAAVYTLINSGTVYAVDPGKVPDDALMAATFRY